MTWYSIAFLPPQYENTSGIPYSGAVLKAYAAGTTTNIPLATDFTGVTTAASLALNSAGYPVYGANVVIPHVQQNYKLALYPTQAAADANSGAVWTVDNIEIADDTNTAFVQYFSGDGATENFTLSSDLGTDEKELMVFADRVLLQYSVNGDFATDTVWTKGAGWTISGGAAIATGAISTALSETAGLNLINGEIYTLSYVLTQSAGSITPNIGGRNGTTRSSSGGYIEQIIAAAGQNITFTGAGFTGTVDNVGLTPALAPTRQILRPLDEYTLNGTLLTLVEAPPTGTNNIIVFAPSLLLGAAAASAAAAATSETNSANSATSAAAALTATLAAIGTTVQAYDADLTAIAALTTTGIAVRTATNTWVTRAVAASTNQTTVSNGGGVAGNPTVGLTDDVAIVNSLTVGDSNTIPSGTYSVNLGGFSNTVAGDFSAVIGSVAGAVSSGVSEALVTGVGGLGYRDNTFVQGAEFLSNAGDVQIERSPHHIATTNGTQTNVAAIVLPSDSTLGFKIWVAARRTDADNESAFYELSGCIDNNAGTTALVGTVTKTVYAEDTVAWDVDAVANNGSSSLEVKVTGQAAKTISWVAAVELIRIVD